MKRFLQTTVPSKCKLLLGSKQDFSHKTHLNLVPQRALNDRYRALLAKVKAARLLIDQERADNLTRLPEAMKHKDNQLIPVGQVKSFLESKETGLAQAVSLLREQRYWGAPVREDLEAALLKRLRGEADRALQVEAVQKILYPSQLSPVSAETAELLEREYLAEGNE